MRRAQRLLPTTGLSLSTPHFQTPIISTFRSRPQTQHLPPFGLSKRTFSTTRIWRKDEYAEQAKALNQKGQDKHEAGFDNQIDGAIGQAKELQTRTPWHREGSDKPPVKRMRSAGAMTKGSLPLSSSWIRTISKADVCLL
jgi:hypothetical protein